MYFYVLNKFLWLFSLVSYFLLRSVLGKLFIESDFCCCCCCCCFFLFPWSLWRKNNWTRYSRGQTKTSASGPYRQKRQESINSIKLRDFSIPKIWHFLFLNVDIMQKFVSFFINFEMDTVLGPFEKVRKLSFKAPEG